MHGPEFADSSVNAAESVQIDRFSSDGKEFPGQRQACRDLPGLLRGASDDQFNRS